MGRFGGTAHDLTARKVQKGANHVRIGTPHQKTLQIAVLVVVGHCCCMAARPLSFHGAGDDPPPAPGDDILGYLQFEGDGSDSTGLTDPIALVNAQIVNGALYLTGIYGVGGIGGYSASWRIAELNKDNFSFALQFYPLRDNSRNYFYCRNIFTGGRAHRWISLRTNSRDELMLTLNQQAVVYTFPGTTVDRCQWHTVIVVVDVPSRRIQVVLNGQMLATVELAGDFQWNTDTVSPADFTFTNYSNAMTFHGYADNVLVYGHALSDSELSSVAASHAFSTSIPYTAPEPQSCAYPDSDGDGLTDRQEDVLGTHAFVSDTDSDGLSDYDEAMVGDTDPLWADSDGDGLLDSEELLRDTDPRSVDTDADGLWDSFEVTYGYNPLEADDTTPDMDADRLSDLDEQRYGTDPHNPDSDGDGVFDGDEVEARTDPTTTAAPLPIAYYQFEGSPADSMNHSPDFELKNTYYQDGSLYLNGTYEYAGAGRWGYKARVHPNDFNVDAFTLCFDFYKLPSDDYDSDAVLYMRPWFEIHDVRRSDDLELRLQSEESDRLALRLMDAEDCRWNNLILSADFTKRRIAVYLNGEHVQTATLPDWFRPDTEDWWESLAFTDYGAGRAYYGYVDNFIAFNETISPWLAHQIGTGVAEVAGIPYIQPTPKLCEHPDSDGDGLTDYEEFSIYRTNPNDPDTDGDGILDPDETTEATGRSR